MTPDELYAKGYSLEVAAWGFSLYRTLDGSPGSSDAAVERVAVANFPQPLKEPEAAAHGWRAAELHYVKERLSA
jgi:hypothetical protein